MNYKGNIISSFRGTFKIVINNTKVDLIIKYNPAKSDIIPVMQPQAITFITML